MIFDTHVNSSGVMILQAGKTAQTTARTKQKEARRKAIIAAGLEVFSARGFAQARLDDVAELVGVSKGTIYLYFDSKRSLFEEIIRENLFPARDEVENLVNEFEGSSRDLLIKLLQNLYDNLRDEKMTKLVAMIIGEGRRFPELSEFFFREIIDKNQTNLQRVIKRGVDSGEFKASALNLYPQIMVAPGLIAAIWSLHFDHLSPLDFDDYARRHIEFMLEAISA